MKRAADAAIAAVALAAVSPLLAVAMLAIWLHDRRSPLYRAERIGRGGATFRMLKLRTMVVGADARGPGSTARSDVRITSIGHVLRRAKIDELPQLWNVLTGEMGLAGPRPNTCAAVARYTPEEMRLLSIRPGMTDPASIVFSDEADILDGAADPDVRYDAVIRPWKSRLGLLYVEHRSLGADLGLLCLTVLALVAKPVALAMLDRLLVRWGADEELRRVCRRHAPLPDAPRLAA